MVKRVFHSRAWRLRRLALAIGCCAAWPALALEALFPPDAEQTAVRLEPFGSYALPIGPWADGSMLTRLTEGRVEQTGWRSSLGAEGTLELMAPLRDRLAADGWRVLYECETHSCGGFDFRYSTRVLPEPDMHVDLGDFRFLSARKGSNGGEEHLSLLVSRSTGAGAAYAQMIHVGPRNSNGLAVTTPARTVPAVPSGPVGPRLAEGTLVLEGLEFATGAADVARGGDDTLAALAGWLRDNPAARIALVGHTDASGSLDANVTLSRRRAEAVRQRLARDYGVEAARMVALGAGFMAPRASNQTDEGRALNRRVEAMLTTSP